MGLMILTVDKRNDLVLPENKLERLYLIQDFRIIKKIIIENRCIPEEKLDIINNFLNSGKAHYEGDFIDFHHFETSEVFSLISNSLPAEQILQFSFKENVERLINGFNNLSTLKGTDRDYLVNFLSNLINNLTVKETTIKRNYFDW